jgi:hypothetical protein
MINRVHACFLGQRQQMMVLTMCQQGLLNLIAMMVGQLHLINSKPMTQLMFLYKFPRHTLQLNQHKVVMANSLMLLH